MISGDGKAKHGHGGVMPLACEQGATAVIVAVTVAMLFAIGALAVDVTHLYSARKDLQNAADACALAAARKLYNTSGTQIQATANDAGYIAARENFSEGALVELWYNGVSFTGSTWSSDPVGSNNGDIKRGHWSFGRGTVLQRDFYPSSSMVVRSLNASDATLDDDPNFINAVSCKTRREATEVTNFLAPILSVFGGDFATSTVHAEAVAVRGFAGKLEPHAVDQPVGICRQSIVDQYGVYSCNVGMMSNSGSGPGCGHQTAGWTDFDQTNTPCSGGTNTPGITGAICSNGNPVSISLGFPMATNGGTITPAMNDLKTCWEGHNNGRTTSWELTLPVIDCDGNNVTTCQNVVGAVTVDVLWITDQNDTRADRFFTATQMDSWRCSSVTTGGVRPTPDCATIADADARRQCCWDEFVPYFQLKDPCGAAAVWDQQVIYFKPSCTPHAPTGQTGGTNFGVLAEYPALVR